MTKKNPYPYLVALAFVAPVYVWLVVGCPGLTIDNSYHNHIQLERVLVKDTAEVKRWKAESKRFEKSAYDYQQKYYAKCREVKQLQSVKIETVIIDTNWLDPRFYFVDHPDSIRINKRIEKFRQEDKKDWDMIEYRWEVPWRRILDSINEERFKGINVKV